ncbi:MAG: transposase [Chloroflexi bacterium]|nr:transposase [Chloroflexota bacterium]
MQSLNKALRAWEWVYNHIRPHCSLGNMSQYIDTNYPQLPPTVSHALNPYNDLTNCLSAVILIVTFD